tara:strand:+ start:1607 stop:2050 length:444 start_codon:yes stop_codon:yes gene_type:complete
MNLFEKIQKGHFRKDPEEYIYAQMIYKLGDYDILYENQLNQEHEVWQEFRKKYNLKYHFCDDLKHVNLEEEVICLWFFTERSDRDSAGDIAIGDKIIVNKPNAFFITLSRNVKIVDRKKYFPRRPCVQISLTTQDFVNIKKQIGMHD